MSVKFDKLENNKLKMTIEVSKERLEEATQASYNKNKGRYQIQGFRKGKAPRKMIEKMYGPVFLDDAINTVLDEAYPAAYDEAEKAGYQIMSRPSIGIESMEDGITFGAEVALRPECELGEYKGLEIDAVPVKEVTDEDVDAEIKRVQERNARTEVVERAAEMGDTAKIDFAGTIDGVAFDGGAGEDYDLVLGSGSFIPGFEEQLVGVSAGESKDVVVTFPEDYHAAELAGKEAVFACTVKSVTAKILPELNDEFADNYSDFDTMDAYKADIKANLVKRAEDNAKQQKGSQCVAKAVANAKIEICDEIKEMEADRMVDEFSQQLAQQGMNMQMYMQYTNSTPEALREQMLPEAEARVKNRIVLEELAKAEGIVISDEDVDAEYQKMADMYQMDVETIKRVIAAADIKGDMAVQKVIEVMVESAVEVEKKEESADAE